MAIKHDHYKKLSGHKKINIIPITDRLKTEQKKPSIFKSYYRFLEKIGEIPQGPAERMKFDSTLARDKEQELS